MVYEGIKIPDKELKHLITKLKIPLEEAINIYLDDNNIIINKEAEALTEKAIKSGVQKEMARCKSAKKTERKREPKEDPTKEMIIKTIAETLMIISENVQITDPKKYVIFNIEGEQYTVNLIRNRQKKKE